MVRRSEGQATAHSDGFTVVEVMVVSVLLLIALTMFGSVLYTIQRATDRQMEIAQANDGARLAIQEIDRQLRSGYVAAESVFSSAADSVVVYTEARMSSGSDLPSCVVWFLTTPTASGVQGLWTRSWTASNTATSIAFGSGNWRMVASGIVNSTVTGADAFNLAEILSTSGDVISQELKIRLLLNPSRVRTSQVTEIVSTLAARNFGRRLASAEVQGGGLNARNTLCQVA